LAVFDLGDVFELSSKAIDAAKCDSVGEVHVADGGSV
jgi:hypothetical protein